MNYDEIENRLWELQESKNSGRGVSCVRTVCAFLSYKRDYEAKNVIHNEWDKISNYPDIANYLKEVGFADESWYVNNS